MNTKEALLYELNHEKKVIATYMATRKILNAEILRLQHLTREAKQQCEMYKMHYNICYYDNAKSRLNDLERQLRNIKNKKEELKAAYHIARQKHDAILNQLGMAEILEDPFKSLTYWYEINNQEQRGGKGRKVKIFEWFLSLIAFGYSFN